MTTYFQNLCIPSLMDIWHSCSPHPPHLPKPEIQPLMITLLPTLPVLLLLPTLLPSTRVVSHRLWGAHNRVWSWSQDQVTTRRCPTQLLWTSSIQRSHITWPTSHSLSSHITAGSIKPWPHMDPTRFRGHFKGWTHHPGQAATLQETQRNPAALQCLMLLHPPQKIHL